MIDNPEFEDDPNLGKYDSFAVAGFEIWQVKAGTIFDNLIICDDPAEAEALRKETWEANKDKEKAMFDQQEEEKRKKEEAEAEEDGDDDDDAEDLDLDDEEGPKDEL